MMKMMKSGAMTQKGIKKGHGHGGGMAHDDPNAVPLQPGESAELVWTFRENPGNLEFACTVPGHYPTGTVGRVQGAGH
jgi:uncharacterized cupredoxin-like copper-binding protein